MSTRGEMFAGLTVALVTPLRDGEVDYDGLRELVDWHVEQGTDCLAPVGTTGEAPLRLPRCPERESRPPDS